jgi:hypothetical protein
LKKFKIDVTTVDDVLDKISDSGLSSLGCIDITILKEKIIRIEWFLNGKMDILRKKHIGDVFLSLIKIKNYKKCATY